MALCRYGSPCDIVAAPFSKELQTPLRMITSQELVLLPPDKNCAQNLYLPAPQVHILVQHTRQELEDAQLFVRGHTGVQVPHEFYYAA